MIAALYLGLMFSQASAQYQWGYVSYGNYVGEGADNYVAPTYTGSYYYRATEYDYYSPTFSGYSYYYYTYLDPGAGYYSGYYGAGEKYNPNIPSYY